MEATAKVTYVRISPRKVQIVLDLIRNKPCDEAMAILKHTPKAACEPLAKLLKSAMANAENKDMDVSKLYVAECSVSHCEEGSRKDDRRDEVEQSETHHRKEILDGFVARHAEKPRTRSFSSLARLAHAGEPIDHHGKGHRAIGDNEPDCKDLQAGEGKNSKHSSI